MFLVCPAIKVGSYADPGAVNGYPTSQMRGPCVASVVYCEGRSRRAGVGEQLVTPSPEYPSQHWHANPPDTSAVQSQASFNQGTNSQQTPRRVMSPNTYADSSSPCKTWINFWFVKLLFEERKVASILRSSTRHHVVKAFLGCNG